MAHKKGQGTSRNGRDSPGQRRGVKVYANVGIGRDYTIFAKTDGIVRYERLGKDRKRVSVYSPQAAAEPASAP